jgi:hypothetical protein
MAIAICIISQYATWSLLRWGWVNNTKYVGGPQRGAGDRQRAGEHGPLADDVPERAPGATVMVRLFSCIDTVAGRN